MGRVYQRREALQLRLELRLLRHHRRVLLLVRAAAELCVERRQLARVCLVHQPQIRLERRTRLPLRRHRRLQRVQLLPVHPLLRCRRLRRRLLRDATAVLRSKSGES